MPLTGYLHLLKFSEIIAQLIELKQNKRRQGMLANELLPEPLCPRCSVLARFAKPLPSTRHAPRLLADAPGKLRNFLCGNTRCTTETSLDRLPPPHGTPRFQMLRQRFLNGLQVPSSYAYFFINLHTAL